MTSIIEHQASARLCAGMRTTPYPWGRANGFFTPHAYQALRDTFPDSGYHLCRAQRSDKSYQMLTRNLGEPGAELSASWQRARRLMTSQRYAKWLSRAVGVDLCGLECALHAWKYLRGCFLSPHVDKDEKLLTQLFYFNTRWSPSWGGLLLILGGEGDGAQHAAIPPVGNSTVILRQTPSSWHAVSQQHGPANVERRLVQLVFYRQTAPRAGA